MEFKEWFETHGDSLLKGWLRAREDGNEEGFSDWVVGEFEFYQERPDDYEVPYHGLFDKPSTFENLIFHAKVIK